MNLSLSDVFCMYDFHIALEETAIDVSDAVDFGALTLVILWLVYLVSPNKDNRDGIQPRKNSRLVFPWPPQHHASCPGLRAPSLQHLGALQFHASTGH